jgi:hypothetical protein
MPPIRVYMVSCHLPSWFVSFLVLPQNISSLSSSLQNLLRLVRVSISASSFESFFASPFLPRYARCISSHCYFSSRFHTTPNIHLQVSGCWEVAESAVLVTRYKFEPPASDRHDVASGAFRKRPQTIQEHDCLGLSVAASRRARRSLHG